MSIKVFSLCAIVTLGSASSENGNIFQPVLTYACLHRVGVYTRLHEHCRSSCSCLGPYRVSLFFSCLSSQVFGPMKPTMSWQLQRCSLGCNQLHHINHLIMEVAIPQ